MPSRYIDPHVNFYVRADSSVTSPERSQMQELRRSHDLGLYTVEELEDLLDTLGETLAGWVEENPPHVDE